MLFGTALLQTSFLPGVSLFGAIPDLLLILTVGVGMFDGMRVGIPLGIGAGILSHTLGGGSPLAILLYAVGGALATARPLRKNYLAWCMYMGIACLIKLVWSLVACLFGAAVPRFFAALWNSILPEFLGTALLALALYYPVKAAARLLKRKSEL